jgi:hypothetical protein
MALRTENPNMATATFTFSPGVPLPEAEATLRLAVLAVESLHGADRMQLELHVRVERAERRFVIDTATDVGRTLAVIFSGYARREFGEDAVRVTTGAMVPAGGGS